MLGVDEVLRLPSLPVAGGVEEGGAQALPSEVVVGAHRLDPEGLSQRAAEPVAASIARQIAARFASCS